MLYFGGKVANKTATVLTFSIAPSLEGDSDRKTVIYNVWEMNNLETDGCHGVRLAHGVSWKLKVHICCCSVTKSCPNLCDPTGCSTPGSSVLHNLPKFVQSHMQWVDNAVQPSHPLMLPSPFALILSQHHSLFQWVGILHQVAKVLKLQLQSYSGLISFRMEGRHRKWFNEGRSALRRRTSTVKVQKYEKSQQIQGGQSRSTWLGIECRGWVGLTGLELEWKLESNPKGPCEPWLWSQWEELKGLSWSWGWGLHFRVLFWPCCGNQHRWECETRGTAAICSRGSSRNGHERWQWLVTGCGSENTEWSLDFWALGAWLGSCWWSIACGMKKMEARIRTPFLGKTNSIYWNGKQEKDEILEGR